MSIDIPIISSFNSKGIESALKSFRQLETTSQKAQFAIRKAAVPAAAALAGLAVAAGLSLKAAIEDEAAQSALARQLVVSTGATTETIASVEKYIDSLGKSVAITDDEARPAFAKLALATHDVTKAQQLMSIAIDTAAATSKPLADVAEAMSRGFAGNTKGLKALSPELMSLIKNGASAAEAFAVLEKNFGGAGELAANTTAGQMKVLKIQLDETKEAIGKALIPVFQAVLPLLKSLGTFAQDNTPLFLAFATAVGIVSAAIVAARIAMAAMKAVAIATTVINYALATSFTAVEIATGIGIIAVLAGVAAFVAYKAKMKDTTDEAKKLAAESGNITITTNQTKAAIEGQEVALKTIAPIVDKHISKSKDLTTAKNKETEAAKKKAEATKKEQDAIEAYLSAYSGYSKSIQDTLTGYVSLADAQKTGTDPESGMTIGAAFQKQIADAKAFGENLKTMLKMGLSQAGLGQLLNLGPAAGLKVTDNMILGVGGFGVNELNAGLQSLSDVGGSLGGTAAGAFMGKGAGTNVNITVNAGVGDPVAIGKSVVDALNAYKARTGSFGFVAA